MNNNKTCFKETALRKIALKTSKTNNKIKFQCVKANIFKYKVKKGTILLLIPEYKTNQKILISQINERTNCNK